MHGGSRARPDLDSSVHGAKGGSRAQPDLDSSVHAGLGESSFFPRARLQSLVRRPSQKNMGPAAFTATTPTDGVSIHAGHFFGETALILGLESIVSLTPLQRQSLAAVPSRRLRPHARVLISAAPCTHQCPPDMSSELPSEPSLLPLPLHPS